MGSSLRKNWDVADSVGAGKKFLVECLDNHGYEESLTEGKKYEVEMIKSIPQVGALCKWVGDNGKRGRCHLSRFKRLKEIA